MRPDVLGAFLREDEGNSRAARSRFEPYERAGAARDVGAAGPASAPSVSAAAVGPAPTARHTVDFHLRQMNRKLQVDSRVQLARLAPRRQDGSSGTT
jgi:hypothetical protein